MRSLENETFIVTLRSTGVWIPRLSLRRTHPLDAQLVLVQTLSVLQRVDCTYFFKHKQSLGDSAEVQGAGVYSLSLCHSLTGGWLLILNFS